MTVASRPQPPSQDGADRIAPGTAGAGVKQIDSGLTIDDRRYVPYFLSVVNNGLSWGASRLYLKVYGVGLNEWRVLSALTNEPGIMANRITEMVALNKSVVSRSVRALESQGHLRTQMTDGRRLLYLTASGAALHDRIIRQAMRREEALLQGFSEEERLQLVGFLARMKANLARVEESDRQAVAGR